MQTDNADRQCKRFLPQVFHSIFSSALRAKTYSENIAMEYLRLLSVLREKMKEIFAIPV